MFRQLCREISKTLQRKEKSTLQLFESHAACNSVTNTVDNYFGLSTNTVSRYNWNILCWTRDPETPRGQAIISLNPEDNIFLIYQWFRLFVYNFNLAFYRTGVPKLSLKMYPFSISTWACSPNISVYGTVRLVTKCSIMTNYKDITLTISMQWFLKTAFTDIGMNFWK